MFNIKNKDLQSLERSIKLLSTYHAVPLTNQKFIIQYRHLILLYENLCTQKGKISCFKM